jgi:hypothetical protein
MKLTEDMKLHRKEEVLDRYERKILWMDEKLEQFERLENKAFERYEHSTAVMDRFEVTARIMNEKISDMKQIENVTKNLGKNIEKTMSTTISKVMKESTASFLEEVRYYSAAETSSS